jgi:hypothetical protein
MNVNRAITGWYFVGLDLGQSRDFAALAVVERAEAEEGGAAAAVPGAGTAGDAVSGYRGAGEADDETAGTGWTVSLGGGRDGGGAAGGGPAAEGGVGGDDPAGERVYKGLCKRPSDRAD